MGIRELYVVRSIASEQCREWLLYKHYAGRIPTIEYSFGLYKEDILCGVCTFGCPPRVMNNGDSIFNSIRVKTLELNRLVINDNMGKNVLSFFVSQCLNKLPKPCCIVSYADQTFGHNGYIYQATNWIYTGLNKIHERQIFYNGVEVHPRTACSNGYTNISDWASKDKNVTLGEYTSKHRYFKFLGSKTMVKKMINDLKYDILPYPKGDNIRYDTSYKPKIQGILF